MPCPLEPNFTHYHVNGKDYSYYQQNNGNCLVFVACMHDKSFKGLN